MMYIYGKTRDSFFYPREFSKAFFCRRPAMLLRSMRCKFVAREIIERISREIIYESAREECRQTNLHITDWLYKDCVFSTFICLRNIQERRKKYLYTPR